MKRTLVVLLSLVLLALAFPWVGEAATCTHTAANARPDTIQTLINDGSVTTGSVVCIPAATIAWDTTNGCPSGTGAVFSCVSITKAITLQGAGSASTIITNNYPGNPGTSTTRYLINISEQTTGAVKLTDIKFITGSGPSNAPSAHVYMSVGTGGGQNVLVMNSYFDLSANPTGDAIRVDGNRGVVSSNTFVGFRGCDNFLHQAITNQNSAVRFHGTGDAWTSPPLYGALDTNGNTRLYVENNNIVEVQQAIDVDAHGKVVIRYNPQIQNSGILTHGDTGLSGRYMEGYQNTFVWDGSFVCGDPYFLPTPITSVITYRGGTGLWHHNNIPSYDSGSAYGKQPIFKFHGASLRRNAWVTACWVGDHGSIGASSYPMPYQVGWGYAASSPHTTTDTQVSTGASAIQMDLEPIYIWANTGTGGGSYISGYDDPKTEDFGCGGGESCSSCTSRNFVSDFVQSGREYYVNAQKPNGPDTFAYVPYQYPHPLTGLACTADCGSGGGGSPVTKHPKARGRFLGPTGLNP